MSVTAVTFVWAASGDAAEGAGFGLLFGVVMGSYVHVERHSGAAGVLAAELELEPSSSGRVGLVAVALVLAVALVAWLESGEPARRLQPGLPTGLLYSVTLASAFVLLWLGLDGPWFWALILSASATSLAFGAAERALRR